MVSVKYENILAMDPNGGFISNTHPSDISMELLTQYDLQEIS
jgi:hypothetical protein